MEHLRCYSKASLPWYKGMNEVFAMFIPNGSSLYDILMPSTMLRSPIRKRLWKWTGKMCKRLYVLQILKQQAYNTIKMCFWGHYEVREYMHAWTIVWGLVICQALYIVRNQIKTWLLPSRVQDEWRRDKQNHREQTNSKNLL